MRKAAQGAGLSWGLAEEAGKCAQALCAAGSHYIETISGVLEAQHSGELSAQIAAHGSNWRSIDGLPLSPLVLGPAISDHAFLVGEGTLRIEEAISQPALLLPFLVAASRRLARVLRVKTDAGEFFCAQQRWPDVAKSVFPDRIRWLEISPAATQSSNLSQKSKPSLDVGISNEARARLERLAALTYVSSSERSRASGAGAGLNDND